MDDCRQSIRVQQAQTDGDVATVSTAAAPRAERARLPKPLRTRLRIVDELDAMTREMPMSDVSVIDLCERADVSRTTFYSYFDNLQDVGVWIWDYTMEQNLYQIGLSRSCYDGHLAKFHALTARRDFFDLVLRDTDYSSVMHHAGRFMLDHYRTVIERKRGSALDEFESTRLRLFVVGAKHMTHDWASEGMTQVPELMARVFTDAMPAFALPWLEAEQVG